MENIQISEYATVDLSELVELYSSVGWSNYTSNPDMLRNAFENSLKV